MNDLLRVDFDRTNVNGGGLFLVEIIKDQKVDWRGCRRFDKRLDGVVMIDQSGGGDWKPVLPSLAAWNMRIVGYVEQVYKPSH